MIERFSRRRFLIGLGGTAAAMAVLGPVAEIAHAASDIKNKKFGQAATFEWFHPITSKGEVWSYDYILQGAGLGGSTSITDQGTIREIFLNGRNQNGDTGVNVRTDPAYFKQEGIRTAVWIDGAGAGDQIYILNGKDAVVRMVPTDGSGFGGALLPNLVGKEAQFHIRVRRVSGQDKPIKVRLGSYDGVNPLSASVMDLGHVDLTRPGEVPVAVLTAAALAKAAVKPAVKKGAVVEFLPKEQVRPWQGSEGQGFFRPLSAKGEGYTPFLQFSVPVPPYQADGTPKFSFRDKGRVGEFFALVRGAVQVRLDVKTFAPFVEHIRQYKAAPALWLAGMQPSTVIQLHDGGGKVLATAVGDGAGFGGIELPTTNTQFIITLGIPFADSPHDIQFQMGPATREDLNKSSTLKLSGVDLKLLKHF